ncbi:MAG TPA: DinB family protein [Candidatus Acidoferrales bacterium]|nr:DinB family protein [Candidatus Acidoferrales bacterium]
MATRSGSAKKRSTTRRKPVKKAAPKRRATARRRPAKRATSKSAPRKSTPRKAAKRRAAKRPRRPARFAPAFARQKSGASAKELLVFELERARVTVGAAIQGMAPARAERPIAPGKWSPREIVLHLIARDQVRIDEFDAVLAGRPASWMHLATSEYAAVNEAHLAPLRALSWDAAQRLLQTTRERLLAAIAAAPAEPAARWTDAHPFGAMLRRLPEHDRHHAEQIRTARIRS